MSLVAGISMFLLFAVVGIMNARHPGSSQESKMVIGMVAIFLAFLDIVAFAFGIATICQKEQKKLFGILGLTFSLLVILGTGGLITLGMIASRSH